MINQTLMFTTDHNSILALIDLNGTEPKVIIGETCVYPATLVHTFNVGDVDVELGEFFTGALHALVHRLQDFFRVLFHPSEKLQQSRCINL